MLISEELLCLEMTYSWMYYTAAAIKIDIGPRETGKGKGRKGESKTNECAPSTGGRSARKLTHYPGDVGSSVVGDRVTHYSPSRSADLALSACTPSEIASSAQLSWYVMPVLGSCTLLLCTDKEDSGGGRRRGRVVHAACIERGIICSNALSTWSWPTAQQHIRHGITRMVGLRI